MENNFQPQTNTINPQSPPSSQMPPVAGQQFVPPMYNAPMMMPIVNKVPGAVKFLMKFVAFLLPILGFVFGCLINLACYDDTAEISKDVLNLSATMFIVQLVVLTLPTIISLGYAF